MSVPVLSSAIASIGTSIPISMSFSIPVSVSFAALSVVSLSSPVVSLSPVVCFALVPRWFPHRTLSVLVSVFVVDVHVSVSARPVRSVGLVGSVSVVSSLAFVAVAVAVAVFDTS